MGLEEDKILDILTKHLKKTKIFLNHLEVFIFLLKPTEDSLSGL